ncbi:AbrB/MazE/SpoVT family DNA-binding domain-containing protein [Candidatus Daviesbacteria bacterium]|nr:AbrB/MazE/SpoVT family DNA-binding domain-containing protein [Candidatus Daviesbacteria bacterium]
MQNLATTVTQKGQVTIPVKIRKMLNLKRGDQVKFQVTHKKEVKIKPAKRSSIMYLYGSLRSKVKPNLSGQKLIKWELEMAHQAWAKEANK